MDLNKPLCGKLRNSPNCPIRINPNRSYNPNCGYQKKKIIYKLELNKKYNSASNPTISAVRILFRTLKKLYPSKKTINPIKIFRKLITYRSFFGTETRKMFIYRNFPRKFVKNGE